MPRPIPVTLVAGFLGSGKTSLLHHLISTHEGGHFAVLVEKTGELSFDARALRGLCGAMGRTADVVDEIVDDAEIATVIEEIAMSSRFERVIMEVGGLTQPSYWERALRGMTGLAQVENLVVVVDLVDFIAGKSAPRDFLRAPIASASIVVLNKCDLKGDDEREKAVRRLRELNPHARLIATAYAEVAPEEIFRAEERIPPAPPVGADAPALPAYESVVYRAHRPFHPQRFWNWFDDAHPGLERVKGIVWLATRNLLVGGISRTGVQNSCGAAGIWWAALPREEWPEDASRLAEMQETWREPYGDRRQELVLIGERGPTSDAARKLNLCLLSDAEFMLADWRGLPDPFPEWDLEE